jgi:CheY-like chemotaxis protein
MQANPMAISSSASNERSDTTQRTVLVVDDDTEVRQDLTQVLAASGYDVVTASNGREALSLLDRGFKPALILLDLMMPIMNGWDVLDALANSRSHSTIPVVVASATVATSWSRPLRHCKASVRKPVRVTKLLSLLKEHERPR